MIIREHYLKKLISVKDKDLIKVITAVRRSGKSVLLNQFMDYLLETGISKEQIIYINYEYLENDTYLDYKKLNQYIIERTIKNKKMYLLLDEIQMVNSFEKTINSLFSKGNYDIYLTGSNSKLLSSEIATLLSGRYVEISMLPFSFKEYCSIVKQEQTTAFKNFFQFGSFPYITYLEKEEDKVLYLEGIYNTIIFKDLILRNKINNVKILKAIITYLFDTIGNIVSSKKIANYLNSNGSLSNHNTVSSYINYLCDACLLYKVNRYDIRGKEILNSLEKYYVVDLGLRYISLNMKQNNVGSVLENIVFLELKRRGYKIFTGKIDQLEVDFIAIKNNEFIYIQVSSTVQTSETLEREIKPLLKIKDNYKKVLLTMDCLTEDFNGIKHINILDWLLEKTEL